MTDPISTVSTSGSSVEPDTPLERLPLVRNVYFLIFMSSGTKTVDTSTVVSYRIEIEIKRIRSLKIEQSQCQLKPKRQYTSFLIKIAYTLNKCHKVLTHLLKLRRDSQDST